MNIAEIKDKLLFRYIQKDELLSNKLELIQTLGLEKLDRIANLTAAGTCVAVPIGLGAVTILNPNIPSAIALGASAIICGIGLYKTIPNVPKIQKSINSLKREIEVLDDKIRPIAEKIDEANAFFTDNGMKITKDYSDEDELAE